MELSPAGRKTPTMPMPPSPSEVPDSLAKQAYLLIEELIATLVLAPGSCFTEASLCARTGIGRTPIREALQKLESHGLVTTLPRKGFMVRDMKVEDHLALLEVLRPLDRLFATKAAHWATPAQREALRHHGAAMVQAATAGNLAAYLLHDQKCDELIYEAARNPFAVEWVAPMNSHARRFMCCYHRDGELLLCAQLHRSMMFAVADGDEERAAASSDALIGHLESFTKAALGPF